MAPPVASPQVSPTSTTGTADRGTRRSPTVAARPRSRFERNPAVRVLRTHYVGLAKSVNLRTADVPELVRTSTTARAAVNPSVMRTELGLHYPGPVPFTPYAVRVVDSRTREVLMCAVDEGWGRDPATGRPARPWSVVRLVATVVRVDGRWLVDRIVRTPGSCVSVRIYEVMW